MGRQRRLLEVVPNAVAASVVLCAVIAATAASPSFAPAQPAIFVSPDSLADSLIVGDTSVHDLIIYNTGDAPLDVDLSAVVAPPPAPSPPASVGFHADNTRKRAGKSLREIVAERGVDLVDGPLAAPGDVLASYNNFTQFPSGLEWIDGTLYLIEYEVATFSNLSTFDLAGETVSVVFPIHEDAFDMAWDGQYVWIGKGNGTVHGYDLNGASVGSFNVPFVDYPAIAFDGQYFIVRALLGGNTFYQVDYAGNVIRTWSSSVDGSAYALEWVPAHADSATDSALWMHDGVGMRNVRLTVDDVQGTIEAYSEFGTAGNGFTLAHDGLDLFWSEWDSYVLSQLDDGIREAVDWLELVPISGTVAAGESLIVQVRFDATARAPEEYYADVTIDSNDPVTSRVLVPTHLHVFGVPLIAVSDTLLDFGQVARLGTRLDTLVVSNPGIETLNVSNITTVLPEFAPSASVLSIPPSQSRNVVVSFTPGTTALFADTLTIQSDAFNAPMVKVALAGEGIPRPPTIVVTPDSLDVSLAVGDSTTRVLTVSNLGDSSLTFDISATVSGGAQPSPPPAGTVGFYADETRPRSSTPVDLLERAPPPEDSPNLDPGDLLATYTGFPYEPTGATWVGTSLWVVDRSTNQLQRYDPVSQSVVESIPIHANATGLAWDGQYLWVGSSNGNIYGYDGAGTVSGSFSAPFSASPLLAYDGTDFLVIAYDFAGPYTIYRVDHSGAVIESFSHTSGLSLAYGMEWVPGHASANQGGLWLFEYLLGGLARVSLDSGTVTPLDAFAAPFSNPRSLAHDGEDLWVGQWQTNTVYRVDDGIVDEAAWISFDDTSGTVPPGGSVDIQVTFDAAGRPAGHYLANIALDSNDPSDPRVTVPTAMHVSGIPEIALSDSLLEFGLVFVGVSSQQAFTVSNVGTDTLFVNSVTASHTDFAADPTAFAVPPGSSTPVTVTLSPLAPGVYNDSLTVLSNAQGNPQVTVALTASAFDPPIASVVPDTITSGLLAGGLEEVPLRVINAGAYPLEWTLSADGSVVPWLYWSAVAGTTAAASEDTVIVTLDAADLVEDIYTSGIRLTSNDPVNGLIVIPVELAVDGEPDIHTSPDSLDFGTVYTGYSKTLKLFVANWGTADLNVSSITSTAPEYTVTPTTFTLGPWVDIGPEVQEVSVEFTPTAPGTVPATLTITSDDPDTPMLSIALLGESIGPPVIAVAPDSLTDSLFTNETSVDSFTISNEGADSLVFSLSLGALITPPAPSAPIGFYADETRVAASSELTPPPRSARGPMDSGDILGTYDNFPQITYGCVWVDSVLYAVDLFASQISRYDPALEGVVGGFPAPSGAYGITWDGQYLWVGDNVGNIRGYDLDGNNIGSFSAPDATYNAIAFDGQHFLVTQYNTALSTIYRVDYAGAVIETITSSHGGLIMEMDWAPMHAIHGLGGLWVTNANEVTRLSVTGGAAVPVETITGLTSGSYSIAHDGTDLWWAPWFTNYVNRVDDGIVEQLFVRMNPMQGIVGPGDDQVVGVTFDATDLPRGDYRANIIINSNDPATPVVNLPTHLYVTPIALIAVSDTLLDFGTVFVGLSADDTVTVVNTGTDTLSVFSIATTLADFSAAPGSLTVPPGDSSAVAVTFAPSAGGAFVDTLTIASDAANEPVVRVVLQGAGLEPPVVSLAPDSLVDSLLTTETSVHTMTISNTGGSDLDYNISIAAPAASPSPPPNIGFYADESRVSSLEAPIVDGMAQQQGGSSDPLLATGDVLHTYANFTHRPCGVVWANGELWVAEWGDGSSYGRLQRYDLNTQSVVESYSVHARPWAIAWDGSYFWIGDSGNGNVYGYDPGGNPVGSFSTPFEGQIALTFDGTHFIVSDYRGESFWRVDHTGAVLETWSAASTYNGIRDMQWIDMGRRVGYAELWVIGGDEIRRVTLTPGTVTETESIAAPEALMTAVTCDGTDLLVAPYQSTRTLYRIDDGMSEFDWIAILGDSTGTIAPGDFQDVQIRFEADNWAGGEYRADIVVESNDPFSPRESIPARMHVTGAPVIALSDTTLDFGIVYIGLSKADTLTVTNAGTDVLNVSSITSDLPSVTANPDNFALAATSSQDVVVSFAGTGDISQSGTLTINSDAINDPSAEVFIQATLANRPILALAPDTLRDTLRVQVIDSKPFHIMNLGADSNGTALEFTITSSVQWVWGSPSSGSIPAGDTTSVSAVFYTTPLEPGTHSTTLVVNTNDPVTPQDTIYVELTIDNEQPDTWITGVTPDSAVIDTSEVGYTWTGTDDISLTNSLEYSYGFDGGFGAFGPDTSGVFSVAGLTEGEHTFEVKARDEAGNEDSTPARRTFFLDRSGPVVTLEGPAQDSHNSIDSVTFAWSATDNFTPRDSILYSYRLDSAVGPDTSWSPDTTVSYATDAETTYTFTLRAWDRIDKPGHITTVTRDFVVDRTPPEGEITSGPGEGECHPSTTVTFTWTGDDSLTATPDLTYAFKIDDDTLSAFAATTSHTYNGLAPGAHTFTLVARDLALNEDPTPEIVNFTVGDYDLVPVSLIVPDTVLLDDAFPVEWTARNEGDCTLVDAWMDKVYLSADSALGVDDLLLLTAAQAESLVTGAEYGSTESVTPSGVEAGDYWVVVELDAGDDVLEENGPDNNVIISGRMHVRAPPHPDLRVTSIVVPDTVWSGQGDYITWTVQNVGDAPATGPWWERVLLSDDEAVGDDTHLDYFSFDFSLPPGSTYTHIHPVVFPHDIEGDRWIAVCTDWYDQVEEYESDSDNCTISDTTFVKLSRFPNLVVDTLLAPESADAGDNIVIEWVVKNVGAAPTNAPEWYDLVYLNSQPLLSGGWSLDSRRNGSYLPPLASYRQENVEVVIPPSVPSGTYHLMIHTDHTNQVDEHNDEGDNVWTATTINITQPDTIPQPDLEAKILSAPSTGWVGIPNQVTYKVTNYGDAPAGGSGPTDWILLSRDTIPNPDADTLISDDIQGEPLDPGESYIRTATVTFPESAAGPGSLYVWTDVDLIYDDSDLNNNFSSMWDLTILVPPKADLAASGVFSPTASVIAGGSIDVYWTVTNEGAGPGTQGSWTDGIYLSFDDSLVAADDEQLKKVVRNGFLDPDSSYTRSTAVTIPAGTTPGSYYLIVRADEDDQVDEEGPDDPQNNIAYWTTMIEVVPPPAGDLRVDSVLVVEPIYSGTSHDVSWWVKNYGPHATTATYWVDRVYISPDSVLETDSDRLLASAAHYGTLGVGAPYSRNRTVAIPEDYWGPYYVFVVTDAAGHVYEAGNEGNNVDTASVVITLTPPPDLRLSDLTAPDSVDAGGAAAVHWLVSNQGAGETAGSTWYDRFYLSSDTTLDGGDTQIASVGHTGVLAAGEFYTVDRDIDVPATAGGDCYLIGMTDAVHHIYEHTDEDNNTSWRAVYVEPIPPVPPPDLVMTTLEFVDGERDTLTYRVDNISAYSIPAQQRSWYDRFYLSSDTTLDAGDDFIASFYKNSDVPPGTGYSITSQVSLPNGADGDYYLIGVTDKTGSVTEADEGNNQFIRFIHVDLVTPDLQVTSVTHLDSVTSGQPLEVVWTVSNQGQGTTLRTSWYDAVYLSVDRILDATDHHLGNRSHSGALAFGESYTESLTAIVPLGFSGKHYVFVHTDRGNVVYEHLREDNNISYNPQGVEVVVPPESDLVVSGVTKPDTSVFAGDQVEFTWTLANQGVNAVQGQWTDAAYVSIDDAWDINDVLLGNVNHTEVLAAGAEVVNTIRMSAADFTALLDSQLPGLVPGGYHVVVRADIFNNINETHEDNNDGSSLSMDVDVTTLTIGDPHPFDISLGAQRHFRVAAPGGQDIRFVLQQENAFDELELFVSYGEMPTRLAYEFKARVEGNTSVVVPRTSAGDLFLLVYGDYVFSAGADTITAEALPFGLTSAAPTVVGNTGFAALSLLGGQLSEVNAARLTGPGGAEIDAWRVDVINSTNVIARFDLRGAPAGTYDVAVMTDSLQSTLFSAIDVVAGTGPVVTPYVDGPDAIRDGSSVDYLVTLVNSGDADAHDVITGLTFDMGAEFQVILPGYVGPLEIAQGQQKLVYNHLIEIGGQTQFSIRIFGTADFSVNVVAVHTEPIFFDLGGDSRVISSWVEESMIAFEDTMSALSVVLDNAAFEGEVTDAWTSPPAGDATPPQLLGTYVTSAFVTALDSLGHPELPPTTQDAETAVGIVAAINAAEEAFATASVDKKYKTKRKSSRLRVARDPNEKVGSADSTGNNFVSQVENIPYTVYFENVDSAEASALQVVITDVLDPSLDSRKFRLGEIAFGDRVIPVPGDLSFYETTVTLDNGLLLEIDAGIDVSSGLAMWRFDTIDPTTGLPPLDPDLGFLPPNDSTGVGEGHVFFTVRARADALDGVEIRNRATIVFDGNEAIETNEVTNTLRKVYPDLHVTSATGAAASESFVEGTDITISAAVSNLGEAAAGAFNVGFYHGNPDAGGTPIDLTRTITSLDVTEERVVQTVWSPDRLVGTQDIYIKADHVDVVDEGDAARESNNVRILSINIEPRTYRVSIAQDINMIALPLEPQTTYTARSLAGAVGANVIIRYDSSGAFESFTPDEQQGDGFVIVPSHAYIVVADNASTPTFSGVTHEPTVQYGEGLNPVSLPLDPAAPLDARSFANRIGADQLIRYNTAAHRFETFLPDFHETGGFGIRGGEGYLAFCQRDTLVTHAGLGWEGTQPPQTGWGGSAVPSPGAESAPVMAVVGAFIEERWGAAAPTNGQFTATITNTRSNVQVPLFVDESRGTFAGTFVDFTNSAAVLAGDVMQVTVENSAGEKLTETTYTLTKTDIERRYARIDVNVAGTPGVTRLFQNYPNPFNPSTTIRYQISAAGRAAIHIYNVRGQLVKTIVDKHHAQGYYRELWRGDNNQGQSVASGVYFYRLVAPGHTAAKKMVLIR